MKSHPIYGGNPSPLFPTGSKPTNAVCHSDHQPVSLGLHWYTGYM